jgi:hypothetical protein
MKHTARMMIMKIGIGDFNSMKKSKQRRTAKITPELASILMEQEQLFVEQFGREMGPDHLIFFNLNPEDVKRQVIEAMEKTGIALN